MAELRGSILLGLGRQGNLKAAPFYLFLGVVSAAPLPFGSHNSGALAVWCFVLAVALAGAPKSHVRRPHAILLLIVMGVAAVFMLHVHQQSAENAWLVKPDPIWAKAEGLLGGAFAGTSSVVRDGPYYSLGPTLVNCLTLSLAIVYGAAIRHARRLLTVVAWSGAAYAIFGIISTILDPTTLLGRERHDYVGVVLGTFINRNTAATYFGTCSAVWILLFCEEIRETLRVETSRGMVEWQSLAALAKTRSPIGFTIRLVGALLCLGALFMTNSRAGVLCSISGMTAAMAALFYKDFLHSQRRFQYGLAAGVGALLLLIVLGGAVNHRFETQGFSDEGRVDIYRATFHLIVDHPLFGVGLGSFTEAFPTYRQIPPSVWGIWDMAHSTPLDLAAEVGVPLAALVCLCGVLAFGLMVLGFYIRRRDRIVPLIGATVAWIGVMHSCIDFSLQIPGYSIVWMAIIGAGLSQSFRSLRSKPTRARPALSLVQSPTGV